MPTTTARTRPGPATGPGPVRQFFTGLAAPGQLDTFAGQSATLRFDVRDDAGGQSWYLTISKGEVAVSGSKAAADAVITIGRPQLEAIVTGRLNAQAAILRGLLTCTGSMAAFIMFQRCLPGPRGSTGRVAPISSQQVMAQRRPG